MQEINPLMKILDQVGKVKIKSVTDSLFRFGIWLIGFGTTSAIFKAQTWVAIFLFSLGGIFLVVGLYFFWYFAKRNPDYLRSEIYQLRKQSLELLGDKDNMGNPNLQDIPLITSPYDEEEGGDETKKLG